jgi:carboxyl-terminal processing protease
MPMKLMLSALLLLPNWAAAEFAYTGFKSIRESAVAAPAAGPIVPVKFKFVPGPAAEDPEVPPRLPREQVGLLLRRLGEIDARSGKPGATRAQVQRLIDGLMIMDIKFVDPIPPERWAAILKEAGDLAQREYGVKTKDWGVVIDHMLQKAVSDLKEPHSVYMDPVQAKAFMDMQGGRFTGIGVSVTPDPKGLRIVLVFPGSGAEAAGLQDGDVITRVDGKPVAGLPADEIVKRITGEPGTSVAVKVLRGSEASRDPFKVVRSVVSVPNAFSKMAAPGIGYVYFHGFHTDADEQVLSLVGGLKDKGARSIILDVRGNPGGQVQVVASIASEFLEDKDDIVSFKHQGQVAQKAVTDGDGKFSRVPVVVLVDGHSASASEILSAAMQDKRKGCAVIGSRTYGKGTEQVSIPQEDRLIKLTENRWYSPADRNIDARRDPKTGMEIPGTGGVVPDVVVEVPQEQAAKVMRDIVFELFKKPVIEPRTPDPVLEKALEVLSQGKAG